MQQMALDPALVQPGRTAVVLHEMQRSTVGDRSSLPMLVEAAAPAVVAAGRLVVAARAAGVEVVHCVAASRVDLKGSNQNTVFGRMARREAEQRPRAASEVAAASEVVPSISVEESDLLLSRLHGMSAITDSGLDMVLRNLGVSTMVVGGVSLNIGVTGLVIGAVDRGYNVVLVKDATAGVPPEYGDAIIEHSLSLITRITTVDELTSIWAASGGPHASGS